MPESEKSLKYELIEHTGDVGIKIYGDTLKDLFINAAFGMFEIMAEISNVQNSLASEVEVAGDNYEELLVNWLSELNYLFIAENQIFNKFEINRLTDKELFGIALGEKFDPHKHLVHREIKAVTYHELYVKQIKNRWQAQIIFDI